MTSAADDLLLSVVVCTHNRGQLLETTIRAVATQQAELTVGTELVIVDSASVDETPRLIGHLEAETGCRVIRLTQKGLARARNAGIAAARGGHIVFLDDDAVPRPGWLATLAKTVVSADPAFVAGRVLLAFNDGAPPMWLLRSDRAAALLSGIDLDAAPRQLSAEEYPVGANMAVRTSSARELGGFDLQLGRVGSNLLSMEEVDFVSRLRRLTHEAGVWVPAATVDHQIPRERTSRSYLLRRAYWQGRSQARWTALSTGGGPRSPKRAITKLGAAARHCVLALSPTRTETRMDRFLDAAYECGRALGALERRRTTDAVGGAVT